MNSPWFLVPGSLFVVASSLLLSFLLFVVRPAFLIFLYVWLCLAFCFCCPLHLCVFTRRAFVQFSPSHLNLIVRSLSLLNHCSSHFSRETSACLRTRCSRSTPISPRCGFGIAKVRSPLTMYGCFPPRYGPSNPSFLSRLTRSSQETGVSLATDL